MTHPDEMVELGRELTKAPQEVAVRKAVHCAYYAVFGALCQEWAKTFVAAAHPHASRMLSHTVVKDACNRICSKGILLGGTPCPKELKTCATLIPQLQREREDADYAFDAKFAQERVHRLLDDAHEVIGLLQRWRGRSELHLFLLGCAGCNR